MSEAEDFRNHLIAIACIDGDVMGRAGFCADTIKRMMRDPVGTFQRMTQGERSRFWPLVKEHLRAQAERTREFVGAMK
jgi:hypothetical protein